MTGTVVLRDLTKRFGQFTAVDGQVHAGEVVGLLGANGAGKTTLMRMLLGLLLPTSGEVRVFGAAPGRESRRRTGYVPQGLGLYRDLTVAENLHFAARVFGTDPAPGFDDVAQTPVRALPLGRRRRLAFAIALRHRPDLLVLDEPTSGVAALARVRLWDEIRSAAQQGAAVLVSTHAMDEARQADRLVLMHAGAVVGSGSEADIVGGTMSAVIDGPEWATAFGVLERAGLPATLDGTLIRVPGADAATVQRLLAEAGLPGSVQGLPATLEEAMVLAEAPS